MSKEVSLSREQVLKAFTTRKEKVKFAGGTVYLAELGASELVELWNLPEVQDKEGSIDIQKLTPRLIVRGLVDGKGMRLLEDNDLPCVAEGRLEAFTTLAAVARRLNGLSGDIEKNSEETEQDALPSVSVSN